MIKKLITAFSIFLTAGCGYKVINKAEQSNYSISNISSTGDRRINYILKNNLSLNSKNNSKNVLNLELNSIKTKTVKEKNIQNQIIKYKISVNVNAKFNLINNEKIYSINSSNNGDYVVSKNQSSTISKEKSLIRNLVENISNDIEDKISAIVNDF
jgi:outer membrane lipopolysaccharide assembly protein LptE/RlpB